MKKGMETEMSGEERTALEATTQDLDPENFPDLVRVLSGNGPGSVQEKLDTQTKKDLDVSASKSATVPKDGSVWWKVYKLELQPGGGCKR